jgi:hypothetical protein
LRANQVIIPLLSLVDDPGLRDAARAVVRKTHAETMAERAASPASQLIALLVEIAESGNHRTIPLAELASRFVERHGGDYERPVTNRYLGVLLRRELDIRPYLIHGVYHVPLSPRHLARRAPRYGVKIDQ